VSSGTSDIPAPARWALIGAVGLGVVGGVVGLVLGLIAHPPTAWFGVFEVGIPSGLLGALLGLTAGSISYCVRRLLRWFRHP
jgi:hypothetical protein